MSTHNHLFKLSGLVCLLIGIMLLPAFPTNSANAQLPPGPCSGSNPPANCPPPADPCNDTPLPPECLPENQGDAGNNSAADPTDSDGDGIYDDDGDGFENGADACPGEPGIANYDNPSVHGCPLDSDRGGIPDDRDNCPNEVSTSNTVMVNGQTFESSNSGCPITVLIEEPDSPTLFEFTAMTGSYQEIIVPFSPDSDGDGCIEWESMPNPEDDLLRYVQWVLDAIRILRDTQGTRQTSAASAFVNLMSGTSCP